jgi:hypothetical protein
MPAKAGAEEAFGEWRRKFSGGADAGFRPLTPSSIDRPDGDARKSGVMTSKNMTAPAESIPSS